MLTLRSSPLVLASRGAQGGYYLSRSPGKITLLEVLTTLEGEVLQLENLSGRPSLEVLANSLQILQGMVRSSLTEALECRTLEDLVREGQQASGFGDWVI